MPEADDDPIGALREALAFQQSLSGRWVPHVDTPPPVADTAVFDVPGDVEVMPDGGGGRGAVHRAPTDVSAFPPGIVDADVPVPPEVEAAADPASGRNADVTHPASRTDTPVPTFEADLSSGSPGDPASGDSDDDAMPTTDLFGDPVPPSDDPSASPFERIEARIPDDFPGKQAETLDELREIVGRTVFIPLDRDRIKPVFGVGDPDADLLIIGEAPGADEDRLGEPFVGRAGQLLTKILSAVGFERGDVYISNILKSRPPGNRDPEPEEVAGHMPILLKQIVLIRPKVLLCVGKTAGNALLGRRSSLASLRDRELSFEGLPLFVTYHPAALLRNEQWKRPTWEDVQMMRARYDALGGKAAG